MEINFEEMLGQVTSFIEKEVKSETIIGKEFQLGEFTCVPVIRVGMGFGSGGGVGSSPKAGKGEGGGAGAGLGISPMGFLVTRNGEISFISANKSKGLSAAFEKVPELIEKYIDKQSEDKKEEATA